MKCDCNQSHSALEQILDCFFDRKSLGKSVGQIILIKPQPIICVPTRKWSFWLIIKNAFFRIICGFSFFFPFWKLDSGVNIIPEDFKLIKMQKRAKNKFRNFFTF